MTTRRTFIQQAGLLTAGLVINTSSFSKQRQTIGLQLYSLRDEILKDVSGVIGKVANAGYKDVETFGYDAKNLFFGMQPLAFKELLKSKGLKSTSGHYNPNNFLNGKGPDEINYFIEAANTLQQQHLIIPYLPAELRTNADDYKALAEKLNLAGQLCKKANLQLAYHNHDFEFQNQGGSTGYDILLKETDPTLVDMEMDLYWVVRAGKNPIDYFTQYPGRFKAWHIKDMDKADPKLNTEIGSGSIDFKKIFANAKLAGVQHYFVEQENFKIDPYVSIAKSCNYIKANLLK